MKYCVNCGAELNENQDICLSCGVKIEKEKDKEMDMCIFILLLVVFWPAAIIYLIVKKN